MAEHPVFGDIRRGDLEEVQRRVLSDPGVLEEELGGLWGQKSPLTYAIHERQTSIALWLIEHRGQHNLDTLDERRLSAIVVACLLKDLPVVKALVAAGADTVNAVGPNRVTPLIAAAYADFEKGISFLLQVPGVESTINAIDSHGVNALSLASCQGRTSTVQLLLDAGADPTIPSGDNSPVSRAMDGGHANPAALLRTAIAEPDRARAIHKARSLVDAAHAIPKAQKDAIGKGLSVPAMQRTILAATPTYLRQRVAWGEELPRAELALERQADDAQLRATVAFVVGLEEGGVEYQGLPWEMYMDFLGYMMHKWADKGPETEV